MPRALLRRLHEYALLTRLNRPIGTLLLLWPALWALWLAAGGLPDPALLAIFLVGTLLTRSAGCIINDFADRDIDPHVERTRERPLAARRVSPQEAIGLFVVLMLLALVLVLQLDVHTVLLSVVAALLLLTYPFFKRFFPAPQLYLGIAFGWAVPMAFTAVQGEVPPSGWLLFAATVTWAGIYDTFYAMVDRDDDRRIGVRSTALLFGRYDLLIIALLQGLMLLLLVAVGVLEGLGVFHYLALLLVAVLFALQLRAARNRERQACFRAFLDNNYVGLAVWVGIGIATLQR
ncbi:MAG: 4-hydroxybenzoate octaprenyltransferase [Gammaproteobacteria bacterium]|nr:4-hydroxybenzoate octaprenyltransferase [Gammaproteobacteria bacterium]